MCFPEGCLIDGQAHRGPGLLRRTLSRTVLDIREAEQPLGTLERRTNAQMALTLAPGPHGSCGLKVVRKQCRNPSPRQGTPTLRPQTAWGGSVPCGNIPLSTHYDRMPGTRSIGR